MTTDNEMTPPKLDAEVLKELQPKLEVLRSELAKRIVGQEQVVNEIFVSLLGRGNCLLVGVPGLAKTMIVRTLAEILDLSFNRIQFTPDLMPSDITGTEIIQENAEGHREFVFTPGPIFTQILLADEINRTPPKTQAALLEAMQEGHVSVGGKTYELDKPFFVLATQNPIEQEGTYPLPEAQLDRFMFSLKLDYPSFEEEVQILQSTTTDEQESLSKVMDGESLLSLQHAVRSLHVPQSVAEYAVRLTQSTRPGTGQTLQVHEYLRWGAGPRASQYLAIAGKVFAALDGRFNVATEDIQRAAYPVLRHRIVTNYHGEADKVSPDQIIGELVKQVSA